MMGKSHVLVNTTFSIGSLCVLLSFDKMSVLANSASRVVNLFIPDYVHMNYSCLFQITNPVIWLSVCFLSLFFGSLFPDIDSNASSLGRMLYLKVKHRTWTHSVWAVLLLFPMTLVHPFARWFFFGYCLHLLEDSVSAGGICFWYPFQKFRQYGSRAFVARGHKLKLYHSGRVSEGFFVLFLCLINTFLFVWFGLYRYYGFRNLLTWVLA